MHFKIRLSPKEVLFINLSGAILQPFLRISFNQKRPFPIQPSLSRMEDSLLICFQSLVHRLATSA